jgi:hypothetical protein
LDFARCAGYAQRERVSMRTGANAHKAALSSLG